MFDNEKKSNQSIVKRKWEDVTSTTVISELNKTDSNALNTEPDLIIKKDNFGSESYQQQHYQYNLLNNLRKRDHYYEDLAKMRDRFSTTSSNDATSHSCRYETSENQQNL